MLAGAGAEIDRVQMTGTIEPAPAATSSPPTTRSTPLISTPASDPLRLAFAPPWAAPTTLCAETLPTATCRRRRSITRYARALAALAERYPGRRGWRCGTSRTPYFWGPAADPEAYAALLEAAYAAVKAVDPAMPVPEDRLELAPGTARAVWRPSSCERVYATGAASRWTRSPSTSIPSRTTRRSRAAEAELEELIEVARTRASRSRSGSPRPGLRPPARGRDRAEQRPCSCGSASSSRRYDRGRR